MKWSLGSKVMVGYALTLLVVPVMGVLIYRSTSQYMAIADKRKQARETIVRLDAVLSDLKDAEIGVGGYLISGQDEYLEPYRRGKRNVLVNLAKVREWTAGNAEFGYRLDQLEQDIKTELAELVQQIKARQQPDGGFEQARGRMLTDAANKCMEGIRNEVERLQKEQRAEVEVRAQQAVAQAAFTKWTIIGGTAVAFVLLGLAGVFIRHSISGPLDAVINVLTTSASQIAAATAQVAANATEAATAVTQTTTTVAEVKQTVLAASQKAQCVAFAAQQTEQASEMGNHAVEEMLAGIHRIREQTDSVAANIVRLSEQSRTIGAIIATVDDLAAQSNLLAVNAAIEAAKAGASGKGFAVVAQEVRNLADQSKQATAQVRSILNDIQRATSSAVLATEQSTRAVETGQRQAEEAGQSVRTLSDSIAQSAQAAMQIAASSQQQLVGMDQLAQAMESIKQASIQNAQSTKQTEESTRSLTELGHRLKGLVFGSEKQHPLTGFGKER